MNKNYGYVVNSLAYDTNNISIEPILEFYSYLLSQAFGD